MAKVVLAYRPGDSHHIAGRICDRLERLLGKKNVVRMGFNLSTPTERLASILQEVQRCEALVVVIGDRWLSATEESNCSILDKPDDWLRAVVETALSARKVIIPVLVNNVLLPRPEELPITIQELVFRNTISVRSDPDFDQDFNRLEQIIRNPPALPDDESTARRKLIDIVRRARRGAIFGVLIATVAEAALWCFLSLTAEEVVEISTLNLIHLLFIPVTVGLVWGPLSGKKGLLFFLGCATLLILFGCVLIAWLLGMIIQAAIGTWYFDAYGVEAIVCSSIVGMVLGTTFGVRPSVSRVDSEKAVFSRLRLILWMFGAALIGAIIGGAAEHLFQKIPEFAAINGDQQFLKSLMYLTVAELTILGAMWGVGIPKGTVTV